MTKLQYDHRCKALFKLHLSISGIITIKINYTQLRSPCGRTRNSSDKNDSWYISPKIQKYSETQCSATTQYTELVLAAARTRPRPKNASLKTLLLMLCNMTLNAASANLSVVLAIICTFIINTTINNYCSSTNTTGVVVVVEEEGLEVL